MPLATYQRLRRSGYSRRAIDSALQAGDLVRVRTGWYASPDTAPDILTAVRCGGSVTCGSALRLRGVWVMDSGLHVRVPPDARVHGNGPRIHRLGGHSRDGVDDVTTALAVSALCMSLNEAVCAFDSAVQLGIVTMSTVRPLLTSPRGAKLLRLIDGRSESGIETLVRLRLRSRGISVRVQVKIAGISRVDLLIGDRLIIEVDGDEWHSTAEQREADRRRDSALIAQGYLVLRVGYWRVINEWAGFDSEVLAVVRRDEHLWRRNHPARAHDVWRG